MKFRNSFVSNSSSTSFIFIFKGNDKDEFLDLIKKYHQFFSLYDPEYGIITFDEIYDSIYQVVEEEGISNINDLISEKEVTKDELVESQSPKFSTSIELMMEIIYELENLKKLKDDGFNNYFIINYGDHEGDVEGGKLGNGMDYIGRYLFISKPELYMYTKQNR